MRIAVVAYPAIDPGTARAIESFRSAHDPQSDLIAAHFTLVFPLDADEAALPIELNRIVRSTAPVDFRLASVTVSAGIDGRSYIFLEPDIGRAEIDGLHARLYGGMLERHLRRDVPFVPHMTVGSNEDAGVCEGAAQILRDDWSPAAGRITELSLLDLTGERPGVLEVFRLAG